jgi:hypothetical protein
MEASQPLHYPSSNPHITANIVTFPLEIAG